jgi:eukaryotic-like serine/threonine-protein kinase
MGTTIYDSSTLIRCPNCSSEVDDGAAACAWCGQAISSLSQLPTGLASPSVAAKARRRPVSSVVGRLASSDAIGASGFTPGTVLAERYRIIGLIGRGGMGEVYRADDLKLGQPVALKFLPKHLSADKGRLERFFAEVRNARQVAHPNVCRVYDIAEIDGEHFLSMEYVDGEDLASLLKRIGRLPPDKALDLARQLCAGLAAAHDRGILHRDLKPANVMLDGRGRARIMDFGLAVAGGEGAAEGETSGTPAYMAPEQFAGKGASVRSDLYALGLVLYELSTGRRAFDAVTIAGYRKKHAEETPTRPSVVLPDFDSAVERVILRCIEKDPTQRPSSATQVAAALPGGDPLAAALAAGETPSPEMVAAAGQRGGIEPSRARWLLLGLAATLALSIVWTPRANVASFVGLEKSPEVLRENAREILRSVGVGRPADSADTFLTDFDFLRWTAAHGGFRGDLSRDALSFAYRQSPLPLAPFDANNGPFPMPRVTELDPPPVQAGMAEVLTDPRGRLQRLAIVPPQREKESGPIPETDWAALFRQAGLDMNRFAPVEPRWTPRGYTSVRAAWEGPHPEHPGVTMRVEAASYRGRPVSFQWIGPWTRPDRDPEGSSGTEAGGLVFQGILVFLVIGSAVVARRNVRAGRGDRRGAARIGTAVIVLQGAMWVLGAHHVAASDEVWIFINGLCNAVGLGASFWMLYLALEPFARRRWPEMLISWSRALSGKWRDPLVGRDLLLGATVGIASGLIMGPARVLLPLRLGLPGPQPHPFQDMPPSNPGMVVSALLSTLLLSAFWVLGIVFLLVLTRAVVRREWIAGLLVTLLYGAIYLGSSGGAFTLSLAVLSVGILVFMTVRFGVLPAIMVETCRRIFGYRILSSDPSNWTFYVGMVAVAAVLAVAFWATKAALAGRPLFGGLALEERAATD